MDCRFFSNRRLNSIQCGKAGLGRSVLNIYPEQFVVSVELDGRSLAEHLHMIDRGLEAYTQRERGSSVLRWAYQAQLLASHVYERIFSNAHLQSAFGTDAAIDSFWGKTRAEQTQMWGSPIDVDAMAQKRFIGPF